MISADNTLYKEFDSLLKQLHAAQNISNQFDLQGVEPNWSSEIKNRQGGYIEIVNLLLEMDLLDKLTLNRDYREFIGFEYRCYLNKRRQEAYDRLIELAHLVSE